MRGWIKWVLLAIVIVALVAAAVWWLSGPRTRRPTPAWQPPDGATARVSKVVDGDTVRLVAQDGVGGEVVVRLQGMDCPESRWNNKCERDGQTGRHGCRWQVPRGKAASEAATRLLAGRKVVLECGRRCRRGGYGRALRYLRLEDGRDFGLEMIRAGLCEDFSWRYPHPRADQYRRVQEQARASGLGMWSR